MLPTFIIGLREGLEAALIVGIIAAFLRQRGQGLGLMWLGVGLAVLLSVAVGFGLRFVEKALPQAQQEMMETVIGAVAVVFVTGMIFWMAKHAVRMKQELQEEADRALSRGGGMALAAMAFLAVLREGFETSVFLLATFQAAQQSLPAALGAALGLALAVLIGWLISVGGMRLNLGRFFRWTGAFLLLVAAGLVMSALRTAHEAGWLIAGQEKVADLSWLVTPGTVQSALITGVLGFPADPRLVEVVGWLAYLVPMALYVYTPARLRPGPAGARRLKAGLALVLAAGAIGLTTYRPMVPELPRAAPVMLGDAKEGNDTALVQIDHGQVLRLQTQGRTLQMPLSAGQAVVQSHMGLASVHHGLKLAEDASGAPAKVDLRTLVALSGGRLPVGISPSRNPGPFDAHWQILDRADLWTADDILLDASGERSAVLTLTGGGLSTPRTLRIDQLPDSLKDGLGVLGDWKVDPAHARARAAAIRGRNAGAAEMRLWARDVPVLLLLAALLLSLSALRGRMRERKYAKPDHRDPAIDPTI